MYSLSSIFEYSLSSIFKYSLSNIVLLYSISIYSIDSNILNIEKVSVHLSSISFIFNILILINTNNYLEKLISKPIDQLP